MHHKEHEKHLEKIKENIESLKLSDEEKSNAWKHIEQWYSEDKAFGSLLDELAKLSPKIEAILIEIGLI